MDFKFCVKDYLVNEISCIDGSLIPDDGFQGADRAALSDCEKKITLILDKIGEASAIAQGLQTAVTSAEMMRESEHRVYLLTDPAGNNGLGQVVGLLKMGHKKLYVYGEKGALKEMYPLCVLDFYVHESKQRLGLGKKLYEHMLKVEHVTPEHLALDRPSEKFLSFLMKHYNLKNQIPQMNNFVVYDGFFQSRSEANNGSAVHLPTENFYGRPAAGRNTHGVAPTHGRAMVSSRPHSSMSEVMGKHNGHQNNNQLKWEGQSNGKFVSEDHGDVHDHQRQLLPTPPESVTSEPAESVVHKDMKFHHQALW